MHAGKAVTDLREIFAKKEQEIREMKKLVEVEQQRVQSVHAAIQRQRQQTEINRSDLSALTARVSGLAHTVHTNAREEAEEMQLIDCQVEKLRALETELQDINNKQIDHDLQVINAYVDMNTLQKNERSQCSKALCIPVASMDTDGKVDNN